VRREWESEELIAPWTLGEGDEAVVAFDKDGRQ